MSSLESLTSKELAERLRLLQQEKSERRSEADVDAGPDSEAASPDSAAGLAHELHVHQVELEMQNRELRDTQGDLEASRARYAELYDRAPVGYATLDPKGLVLEINLTGAGLLGLERIAVIGAPLTAMLAKASSEPFFRSLRAALDDDCRLNDDVEVETKYTQRVLQLTGAPNVSDTGAVGGALMAMRDVTDQRKAQAQRAALDRERRARAEADVRDHMKDQFLGVVSHELRAPLNAILGWLQILPSRANDLTLLSRGMAVMDRNAHLLARLVDDILDVSRIVSGKLQIETTKVDLDEVVQSAIDEARAAAQAKTVSLEQHLTPSCTVIADPMRIHQVVSNLLSNAIKFTSAGGHVDVRVDRVERDVRLTVRDDGSGISPRDLPHIFEHFRQADGSTTRARSGLGLGLAIARHIVEAHAGTIVARSEGLKHGTTLTVHLPAHLGSSPPPTTTDPHPETMSVAGVKVLCVDDQAEALELTALMLGARGAVVRTASSVDDALVAMYEFMPDVLVSDVAMPNRSGYDLVERVAQLPEPLSSTPAIALTAYARSDDAQRALRRGFACHVGKPVNADELAQTIAKLARGGRYPVND